LRDNVGFTTEIRQATAESYLDDHAHKSSQERARRRADRSGDHHPIILLIASASSSSAAPIRRGRC
jgi:hypothetical protein